MYFLLPQYGEKSYRYINLYLQTWFAKTPLGKKRAKAAAGDDENTGRGKSGKKGGKKGSKKGKGKKKK